MENGELLNFKFLLCKREGKRVLVVSFGNFAYSQGGKTA